MQLQINQVIKQLQKGNSWTEKAVRQFAKTSRALVLYERLYSIKMKLKGKEFTVQKTKQHPFYF